MVALRALAGLCAVSLAHAEVTVYSQIPLGEATASATGTGTADAASYTGAAAYDPTILTPPAIPDPAPPLQPFQQIESTNATVQGLSIAQKGTFLGFSIEMSVINQVLGKNSSFIQVPFLNLMSNLRQRAGAIYIRVGGNTQETARLVPSLDDGRILEKDQSNTYGRTGTPPLIYTPDVFYLLSNITELVNVKWYLGVPLNDSKNVALDIAEWGYAVLGDNLLGLQVGNEPDLYVSHKHRDQGYGPFDYWGEFGDVRTLIQNDPNIPIKNKLIGPSLATGDWVPEQVWDTGFIDTYHDDLLALAMEHYPTDNCAFQFPSPGTTPKNPQDVLPDYLNHNAGKSIIERYLNSTLLAQQKGLPFLMFETNTASCGGFAGISNSFASAMWGLDYGFQLAYSNFTGALLHVGGQNVFYNPFTAPPTNQTSFHQWTVGPIYYAPLIIAEALGQTNTSQVVDLFMNDDNIYTPGYAIYENGVVTKLALFNYLSDPSGAHDINVKFAVGGSGNNQPNNTPASVKVKYLLSPTVTSKTNITYAGQTFGGNFESDGRIQGTLNITEVTCNNDNTCNVVVPAPGFALVFLNNNDPSINPDQVQAVQTYSTSALTRTINTATIESAALATSNGMNAKDRKEGSTSKGSSGATPSAGNIPGVVALVAVLFGAWLVSDAGHFACGH